MRKTIKKQLNKSFNNSYNIKKFFNELVEIKEFSPIIKTDTNENAKRQIKYIRNKLHMKIICSNDKYINNKLEKEIFNKKRHNSNKIAKYLSKSCSNKSKSNFENNNKEITKICKNQKQYIKKKINNNQFPDIQNK
jgi:tRNA A37 N6-isopentenylltransferase MiaA